MDAREYLARKGLEGDRDAERPTTLEEKAWARAREAGDHRPRAGTPHDWEDWEHHHDALADGAETLQQKINREAHRRLLEHPTPGSAEAHPDRSSIALARDAGGDGSVPPASRVAPLEPRTALLALGVLVPPLAVGLDRQPSGRIWLCLLLTLLGWVPGMIYALRLVTRRAR
ncbi:MAG: YqaE/Pmp3 family membrane protein [Halomonas sp.]|uniref:YqaE/Pmp3 family membrane protein n=1 Tax=Halomonas sp. TaxID=1486246 RepID=UPI0019FF8F71|nr:YqaE/Pmp3 family membrane protein [Halomonas sp.]MBE0489758.1 YqaE/Pmp3 family membrane protein [Halomonas sp.]